MTEILESFLYIDTGTVILAVSALVAVIAILCVGAAILREDGSDIWTK